MNEGSFPKEFYFTADHPDESETEGPGAMASEAKPRILLMGMRRSVLGRFLCPLTDLIHFYSDVFLLRRGFNKSFAL